MTREVEREATQTRDRAVPLEEDRVDPSGTGGPSAGLTRQEAEARLQQYGYNELTEEKVSALGQFPVYFRGPIPWMGDAGLGVRFPVVPHQRPSQAGRVSDLRPVRTRPVGKADTATGGRLMGPPSGADIRQMRRPRGRRKRHSDSAKGPTMPLIVEKKDEGKVIEVRVSGKLTKEDYHRFVPEVEALVKQHGKIRVLLIMYAFQGWTAGALWEDIKFDLKHFADIERLAFVGDRKWEKGMATFCRPFTTADVRYFDESDIDAAGKWIRAD
jgi:hypothetical protein